VVRKWYWRWLARMRASSSRTSTMSKKCSPSMPSALCYSLHSCCYFFNWPAMLISLFFLMLISVFARPVSHA
jgi:hypothetical protein